MTVLMSFRFVTMQRLVINVLQWKLDTEAKQLQITDSIVLGAT